MHAREALAMFCLRTPLLARPSSWGWSRSIGRAMSRILLMNSFTLALRGLFLPQPPPMHAPPPTACTHYALKIEETIYVSAGSHTIRGQKLRVPKRWLNPVA